MRLLHGELVRSTTMPPCSLRSQVNLLCRHLTKDLGTKNAMLDQRLRLSCPHFRFNWGQDTLLSLS